MKKLFVAMVVVLLLFVLVVPVMAQDPGNGENPDHGYGTQPGYDGAIVNSNGCAGAGAFGAFGNQSDYLHDFGHVYPGDSNGKPGANGAMTGYNNSHNCGNPQN